MGAWSKAQPRLEPESGCIPQIMSFPEKASQAFLAGTPVKLTTTAGTVEICTDGTTGFLGIAQETASGVTGAAIKIMVVRDDSRILAKVVNAGTPALPTTLTQGVAYDWYKAGADAVAVFSVDAGATDGPVLIYEEPVLDVNGDSTYWGVFRLLAGQAGNLDEADA